MVNIECGLMSGMGYVSGLEVSTQEFPLQLDEIKTYYLENTKFVLLATIGKKLVGYVLLSFDRKEGAAYIDRIGVHQDYRRKGVATVLAVRADEFARKEKIRKLRMLVPSYQIEDHEDPWNIEHWLWRVNFKAVGVSEEPCERYGQEYDYYIFERMSNGPDSEAAERHASGSRRG